MGLLPQTESALNPSSLEPCGKYLHSLIARILKPDFTFLPLKQTVGRLTPDNARIVPDMD